MIINSQSGPVCLVVMENSIHDTVLYEALEKKGIECLQSASLEQAKNKIAENNPVDFIIISDESSLDEQISFIDFCKESSFKGFLVTAFSSSMAYEELLDYSKFFLHLILDLNNKSLVTKKINNLNSLYKVKKEKQYFREMEMRLEEESAKLVEVNVNNVKLLADVNKKNKLLDIAKNDIQNLLDNLDQGFMTIDQEGTVQEGFSKSVMELFDIDPLGKKYSELLRLKESEANSLTEWLGMVFEEMLDFDDLKPLAQKSYELGEKYIELDYRVIKNSDKKIERLIVIATDKTVEKQLQEKSQAEENYSKMIVAIAKDRPAFLDFYKETASLMDSLVQQMKKPAEEIDIPLCFRITHSVKGNSAAYNMFEVKEKSHALEDEMAAIRDSENKESLLREKSSFLHDGVEDLDRCFNETISMVEDAFGKMDDTSMSSKTIELSEIEKLESALNSRLERDSKEMELFYDTVYHDSLDQYFQRYEKKIKDIADKLEKEVSFSVESLHPIRLFVEPYKPLLNNLIHAFRNALDHGIEAPDEREMMGKCRSGSLSVCLEKVDNSGFHLAIKDDGRGIDAEKIKKIAMDKGVVSSAEVSEMSESEAYKLLFHAGFSTKEEATEWSGRGVGLDGISTCVQELGGDISIESEIGNGTNIKLKLPIITK